MPNHKQSGFTLVELSIVLVILGLLVGGVLAGQTLIRSSELRSVITERDKFTTGINAFKDKYFALPGDMPNAFAYWGATCGTDATTVITGCNGNGNGKIIETESGEQVKAWEHMSRAGLVEGAYDGTGTAYGGTSVILNTTNVVKSKFSQGYWLISADDGGEASPGDSITPTKPYALQFGGINNYNYNLIPSMGLSNGEALNIDTKTDDGRANTGAVRGWVGNEDCMDAGTDYYQISAFGPDSKGRCKLYFFPG